MSTTFVRWSRTVEVVAALAEGEWITTAKRIAHEFLCERGELFFVVVGKTAAGSLRNDRFGVA